jgi:hypothetical protein
MCRNCPNRPVAVTRAWNWPARELGADVTLQKPFQDDELIAAIEKFSEAPD